MTLQEYDKMMEDYREIEEKRKDFLDEKLMEFLNKDPKDEARKIAYYIFGYAIYWSSNGSSIRGAHTKELADKVHDILVDELMDYMLDDPEVYEDAGMWIISANFGGNYCLEWDRYGL